MKFDDVFQFLNYLLEEMSRCNWFLLQLLGGGECKRTLDREAGVCLYCLHICACVSITLARFFELMRINVGLLTCTVELHVPVPSESTVTLATEGP